MPEKITNNVTQNKAGETVNTAKYQNDGEITMSNNGFSSVEKKKRKRERISYNNENYECVKNVLNIVSILKIASCFRCEYARVVESKAKTKV